LNAAGRFLQALENVFEAIRLRPESFAFLERLYRMCSIQKFPYYILFSEEENTLNIICVAHAKQKPGYWKHRQSERN